MGEYEMSQLRIRGRAFGARANTLLATSLLTFALAFGALTVDAKQNSAATQPITKGQKLFIAGHSFNVFICAPLEALAKEAGLQGHTTYGVQFIGNSTPMQHWNQGTDETNIAKRALRTGELDVFTMSPNAQMPEEAIDKFADLAAQTTPNIRLLVQQSWSAWDGNAPNFASFGGRIPRGPPPAGFGRPPGASDAAEPKPFPQGCPQSRGPRPPRPTAGDATNAAPNANRPPMPPQPVAGGAPATSGFVNADRDKATTADIEKSFESGKAYMDRMRTQLQGINERHHREMAFIVPAAEAVGRLREQVIAGKVPGVSKQSELFADAMGHPGPVLSDVVSYVWFATLYRRSPVGMTALDKENTKESKARHHLLQQIAWQAVLNEPMSGVHAKN